MKQDNIASSEDERRFGGVARLYGDTALARFKAAHICIIGLGGVGTWACEALARTAIGKLTLIDLDMVAMSNTNRQIHALGDAYGHAKVDAMRERVLAINPSCDVHCVEDMVTLDNMAELIQGFDVIIDAIDEVKIKAALAAHCRQHNLRLVMCGGAGGQIDPTRVRTDDLTRAEQDPLLARVRKQLRTRYGFPRDIRRRWDISCVYSIEPLQYPNEVCVLEGGDGTSPGVTGLSCAGYGSSVCVTATFGLQAAACVLHLLKAEHE